MGNVQIAAPFRPHFLLSRAYTQTILASLGLRAIRARTWTRHSREVIFTSRQGVRLQGFFSPQRHKPPTGLVILLHGWEGSAESTYILTTGRYIHDHGYDVLRLNYRDHGDSHGLNIGLFFATNLEEVYDAVKQAAALSKGRPVFLAGFSLGGNFALRIVRACTTEPIGNLCHAVAVSPVLDPSRATDCIDRAPVFRSYFLRKWRRSLKLKQKLFPTLYNFKRVLASSTCREMTAALLPHQSQFDALDAYFKGYSLTRNDLAHAHTPTTIVTAADDPIIPVDDFKQLHLNDHTRLFIQPRGGHNGFIEGLMSGTWYERLMVKTFSHAGPRSGQTP